ncbi:MAG: DUF357 domain-containing protein [Desulfurococcaceae archaeon]
MSENIDIRSKIKAYIDNVENFIERLKDLQFDQETKMIVELAKSYLSDSKYYYDNGDFFTSLACIAYAEGLLDSLRFSRKVQNIDWSSLSKLIKRPRVVVTGSFEFLHPGHIYLLKEAWKMGEVYVIVSRDVNFEKFKGRKPVLRDVDRLTIIESIKYVSKALLGDELDYLKPILDLNTDIVLLGPDQWIDTDTLKNMLKERGLSNVKVLKLEKRIGEWSSSNIYNDLRRELCECS